MVKERVQKILAAAGVDSRRKCEELIAQGIVTVNGKTIKLGDQADAALDDIRIEGDKINTKVKSIYLMFHKPVRTITTVSDMYERATVMHFLDQKYENTRLYPVGRLDRDAEGLLLFTNDGEFANRVMHPRYTIDKTYRVWLDQPFKRSDSRIIEDGMKLEDGWVRNMTLKQVDKDCVEITLHVGRHKVVKRIFDALGYRVTRLIRIKVGDLALGTLKPGKSMELTKELIDKIFK